MTAPTLIRYYPGPYAVRAQYVCDGLSHKIEVSCDVTEAPTSPTDLSTLTFVTKGATTKTVPDGISEFFATLAPLYPSSVSFDSIELWQYAVDSYDASFIGAYGLTVAGTSGGSINPASQITVTFRDTVGGILKIVMLETVSSDTTAQTGLSGAGSEVGAINTYATGNDSWLQSRRNGFPAAFLRASWTQNEAIYRKRYRN